MLWLHLMGIAFATSGIAVLFGASAAPFQAIGFAVNAWILSRARGIYHIAAVASTLLCLGYFLIFMFSWFYTDSIYFRFNPFITPMLMLGLFVYAFSIYKLPQQITPTKRGQALIIAFWLVAIAFLLLIYLISGQWPMVSSLYMLIKLILISLAMPSLTASAQGNAPEGRYIWVFGLWIAWLGELLFASREVGLLYDTTFPLGTQYDQALLLASTAFITTGSYAETRNLKLGLLPFGVSIAGLEVAWLLGIAGLRAAPTEIFLGWLALGGGLILASSLALLSGYLAQKEKARQQLLEWDYLLTQLTRLPEDPGAQPELYIEQVLNQLQHAIPQVVGMRILGNTPIAIGQQTPYAQELIDGTTIIGTLYFSLPFEAPDREGWLVIMAERLGRFMDTVRWQQESLVDPLTGLNRRRGRSGYSLWLNQAQQAQVPIGVVLLDIDHFKQINDTYGHATGDRVLAQVGELLQNCLRQHDLGFRWGGEEFLVLLWDTTSDQAIQLANRIRADVENQTSLDITISAGVSGGQVPRSVAELENWIAEADRALYQAKNSGRNRVCTI